MTELIRPINGPDETHQSLLNAIYERYSEFSETASLCSSSNDSNSSSSCSSKSQSASSSPTTAESSSSSSSSSSQHMNIQPLAPFSSDHGISFYIPPAFSPKITQSGYVIIRSISLVMSDQKISHVGDLNELEISCKNIQELDLSKNEFDDWDEIKKILVSLKKLRLLNLSMNPLTKSKNKSSSSDEEIVNNDQLKNYFNNEWQELKYNSLETNHIGSNLQTLILNSCFIDLRHIECICEKLVNLNELHLSSNNYSTITFSKKFVKPSIKVLYFNNNNLTHWSEVCKLGKCFPNLVNLVLSHNDLSNFKPTDSFCNSNCFEHLQTLIINKLKINDWSVIDQLREFPHLKHVRIQNIPLLNTFNDEEKYYLLVAHLHESIDSLNGSKISSDDKENCERKYIRHFMDVAAKPKRYYELENKHGKLNKLADVNLEIRKRVQVKINYGDKYMYDKVDVRQTVGDFKKKLEKFVGQPATKFKLFYIDTEARKLMAHFSTEELKLPNRILHSFNVRDGDEFEIDLKPPQTTTIHSASEHLFHNSNTCSTTGNTNNLPNLHFHHYNSHFNNNSHHLFNPSSFNSTSSHVTSSKPLPISNRGSKSNIITNKNNSNESLITKRTKPNTLFSKSRIKPANKSEDSKVKTNQNKIGKDEKSKVISALNESNEVSKEFNSSSLPANMNDLADYNQIKELDETIDSSDTAMDSSVEFTLEAQEVVSKS